LGTIRIGRRKQMKTKNGIIAIVCTLFAGALILSSCDNPVSLGKRLNLTPPEVTIDKPDFMAMISGPFEITGTATDLEEIVFLNVSIERILREDEDAGKAWYREWRSERGGRWMGRSADDAAWEPKDEQPKWEGTKNEVTWSINVSVVGAGNGEYLITVGAINNVKNESSLVQRRVIIDLEPPVVTVFTPEPQFKDDIGKTYSFVDDVQKAFDKYQLQNPEHLDMLHNQLIWIQYKIEDDFKYDKLSFQLVDSAGNEYYNKEVPDEELGWSGKTAIHAADIKDPDGNPLPDKIYFKLMSRVWDLAGNWDDDSHGWLIWWPDSDKPWVEGVGVEDGVDPREFAVYPSTEVQGEAYDDDGLAEVSYKVYRTDSDTPVLSETKTNTPLVPDTPPTTFFSWSFTAPAESRIYRIVIDCKDVNGLAGDTVTRYFYVEDTKAPTIEDVGPDPDVSLFGNIDGTGKYIDGTGNFTISGVAWDGIDPTRLRMVWLNPSKPDTVSETEFMESRIKYRSAEFLGWEADIPSPLAAADDYGHKLWEITMSNERGTNALRRISRTFSKNLNLFTDLGIGTGARLTSQTFILQLVGDNGRAVTYTHTVRGDITPPDLAFARAALKRYAGGEVVQYTIDYRDGKLVLLDSLNRVSSMDTLAENDEITITGTWGDDSFDVWQSLTRMGEFKVKWNELDAKVTLNANKTWEAVLTMSAEEAARGGGYVVATLEDLGGNIAVAALSIKVDTSFPVLLLASSATTDGFYKAGEVIDIYLEFNKDVQYLEGPATGPELILNSANGETAKAVWTSKSDQDNVADNPDGLDSHHFTYTVAGGHNAERLNVVRIDMKNGKWHGGGGDASPVVPSNRNVANSKKITIDTTPPTVKMVSSLGGTTERRNHFKDGVTLYLRLEFSEDIIYTPTGVGSTLTLNIAGLGAQNGTTGVSNPTRSGNNALLFTYEIKGENGGDNTPRTANGPPDLDKPLEATAFSYPTGTMITDMAGNTFGGFYTIPPNANISTVVPGGKRIYVDTTPPAPPTFAPSEFIDGYNADGLTFFLNGEVNGEEKAALQYRLKNNDPWLAYGENGVPLIVPGNYNIAAQQKDLAGNASASATRNVTIASATPILSGFGGSPSGTYGPGPIDIELKFSGPVTVGGAGTMSLLLNNGLTVPISGGSGTSTLTFSFNVTSTTTNVEELRINRVNMTNVTLTMDNKNVTAQMPTGPTTSSEAVKWERGLEFFTRIKIDTSVPTLRAQPDGINLSGTTLTLRFSKEIYKGSANLVLAIPAASYRLPAVLTKSQYTRWGGTKLNTWYDIGTNGVLDDDSPDTSEKYILKYDIDPAGTAGLAAAARTELINNGANSVTVPVASGAVSRNGDRLIIDLGETYGYVLPVKGVAYVVTYGANLVQDSQNNGVAALTGTARTVTPAGINPPYIRVQKTRGDYYTFQEGPMALPVQINSANVIMGQVTDNSNGFWNDWPWGAWDNLRPRDALSYWVTYPGGPANGRILQAPWRPEPAPQGEIQNQKLRDYWANVTGTSFANITIREELGGGTWEIQNNITRTTVLARQPYTAQYRIDCQTPTTNSAAGGYIRHARNEQASNVYSGRQNGNNNFTFMYPTTGYPQPSVNIPSVANTNTDYTAPVTLGNAQAAANGDINGQLFGIRAVATITTGGTTYTESTGEKVARSVVRFTNVESANNWGTLRNLANNGGKSLELWIRGGDGADGGANLTPGFPMSWDEKNLGGARLFSSDSYGRYWITWELSARPAYFHFLAGTVPRVGGSYTAAQIQAGLQNGPWDWSWAKNAWAFQYSEYPLYPGASLEFRVGSTVSKPATENFEFYDSFGVSRTGN
jgi:hypothetical protein